MRHLPLVTGTGGRDRFAAVRGGPQSEPDRQARDELIERLRHSDYLTTELDHETEEQVMQVFAPVWQAAIRDLDVPQIRLHDARHTCATLMHLQGVPIALVAAWLGHADVSFTLRTYVHAQPEALAIAAQSFAPPASSARD
jgi:integrase